MSDLTAKDAKHIIEVQPGLPILAGDHIALGDRCLLRMLTQVKMQRGDGRGDAAPDARA